MTAKHAIGITVNGTEVRAAFLTLVRGKARIKALESTTLDAALEYGENGKIAEPQAVNDLENAFDIQDAAPKKEEDLEPTNGEGDQNVSKVYALLDKFHDIKASVAINAPHLTVKYDFIESQQLPRKKKGFKDRLDIWGGEDGEATRGVKHLDASDGKTLVVDYEYHPPVIELMEEVNQFCANNLNLVLMDTNELALIDLVKEIYKFEKNEVTAIVYIEQDFSRVIFLKGKEIYHITPILHKGSMSDDVLEVLYSRIIFAQDQYFIPEIDKILVAGHSSRLKAKYYFRQKFPSAITGYLNSRKIHSDLRFKDRGLLFSRYAVPIALAWKALIKNAVKSKEKNFLPDYIVERQAMPKLAFHGYFILFMITATALTFTWALVTRNLEIRKVTRRNEVMRQQIDDNKSLTERVHAFDDQIVDIERKIALVDSFSKGYDETMLFLQQLNKNIVDVHDIWVTDFKKSGSTVNILGIARRRDKIPLLANSLGGANLKKVTRSQFENADVFSFQLEKKLDVQDSKKNMTIFSFLRRRNGASNGHTLPTAENKLASRKPKARDAKPATSVPVDKKTTHTGPPTAAAGGNDMSEYLYVLKVGSYATSEEAARAQSKCRNHGYKTHIWHFNKKGQKESFTLIVGPFSRMEEAKKASDKLALQSGSGNRVLRIKKPS